MYGYVRPLKPELKLREYEAFRGVYCGLCEELRRRYGFFARFAVNYDMTFLAMLLGPESVGKRKHCPRHPIRKVFCLCSDPSLSLAADISILLGWYKLRDDVEDKPFFSSLKARLESLFLKSAFQKCRALHPDYSRCVQECLTDLHVLETAGEKSLDRTADCFARLLSSIPLKMLPEEQRRIGRELLYHLGRSIYILDAADDLEEDRRKGRYNPLLYRSDSPAAANSLREELRMTLNLSQRRIAAALALRRPDRWQSILENIVELGLPAAAETVLTPKTRTDRKKEDRE